jgi:hypothetical protein
MKHSLAFHFVFERINEEKKKASENWCLGASLKHTKFISKNSPTIPVLNHSTPVLFS